MHAHAQCSLRRLNSTDIPPPHSPTHHHLFPVMKLFLLQLSRPAGRRCSRDRWPWPRLSGLSLRTSMSPRPPATPPLHPHPPSARCIPHTLTATPVNSKRIGAIEHNAHFRPAHKAAAAAACRTVCKEVRRRPAVAPRTPAELSPKGRNYIHHFTSLPEVYVCARPGRA